MNLDPVEPHLPEAIERRDVHECGLCHNAFAVTFEAEPGEPLESAPVACPHCWRVTHVPVARTARWDKSYRADSAS